MSRTHQLRVQLSSLHISGKRIVYLITEDRDILEDVFVSAAAVIRGLTPKMFQDCRAPLDRNYNWVRTRELLTDLYPTIQAAHRIEDVFLPPKAAPVAATLQPRKEAFYYLNDFHTILPRKGDTAKLIKQFLNYAGMCEDVGHPVYLLLIAPVLQIPDGFLDEMEIIDLPELSEDEIREKLLRLADPPVPNTRVDSDRIDRAAHDLKGLTSRQIAQIVKTLQSFEGCFYGRSNDSHCGKKAQYDAICKRRVELAAEAKRQAAQHDSTVTLMEPSHSIAGMDAYCSWLDTVGQDLLHPEQALAWGSRPPKGVLLTGVPGSGKTQAAKKTAAQMGVSLVQLRMDNLLGGLVGDSEANFKRCRKRVEALAPCVVLIDEMEKIFGTTEHGSGNHDVKMNLLAALLDWLQENKKPIFFFATSNSVGDLRPELLRDGRFDRRFSVFMPTYNELVKIFHYHMDQFDRLSGGRLFQNFSGGYDQMARDFLDKSTQYAKKNGLDLFYTGANIENLISQTNRALRTEGGKKNITGISRDSYLEALLKTVESGQSQPYGVTNMDDIARFWVQALKNQYTSASALDLFPFQSFDRKKGEFSHPRPYEHAYDEYMFTQVSAEIKNLYREMAEQNRRMRE